MTNIDVANLKQTIQSPGWRAFEKYVLSKIEAEKNCMITCPEDQLTDRRAAIKAYQSLLREITVLTEKA